LIPGFRGRRFRCRPVSCGVGFFNIFFSYHPVNQIPVDNSQVLNEHPHGVLQRLNSFTGPLRRETIDSPGKPDMGGTTDEHFQNIISKHRFIHMIIIYCGSSKYLSIPGQNTNVRSMDYDALVVGAGHAGIEAGLALARLGYSTILVTQNLDTIGQLSCNPAVGGLAKGNMVREIDALGGEMGRLIDDTMIQFRVLNRSRGPAVQAPRAQADKPAYRQKAKYTLELQKNLYLFQDTVVDLLTGSVTGDPVKGGADPAVWCDKQITGVLTERGNSITAWVVVLTTGTFM
jgi:hypothetical protein